jgi:hypothetical protein
MRPMKGTGYLVVKLCRGGGYKTRCSNNRADNLHWGTRKQNVDERRIHGNGNVDQQNPMAKLTNDQVREIRRKFANGEGDFSISREYGVSEQCISDIREGRTWSLVA